MSNTQEESLFTVVVNDEEQYSIWPTLKKIPSGWREVGMRGSKNTCLDHIKEVWTDMRPLSLRKKMNERQKEWEEKKSLLLEQPVNPPPRSKTVDFLTQGWHPISCRTIYKSLQAFEDAIKSNHLHITFTDTKGKTTLSLKIDPENIRLNGVDFEKGHGEVSVKGSLTLDFVKVYCLAKIDLTSLEGSGTLHLAP